MLHHRAIAILASGRLRAGSMIAILLNPAGRPVAGSGNAAGIG
ncbi:hypothetical protein [Tsuneonella suprasediminis]